MYETTCTMDIFMIEDAMQISNLESYIKLGDCLELMKEIPDNAVDMVLCDLPYGMSACRWDCPLPLDTLWMQYKRLLKPNGVVALFGSQPYTSQIVMSRPDLFREELIWLKNRGPSGLLSSQRHIKIHENILIFSMGTRYTYNPQKWLVDDKAFLTQRKTFPDGEVMMNNIISPAKRIRKPDTGERNPLSIVSARVPFTPQKSKQYSKDVELRYHPTQKPIALCEYLIKTYTNDGDVVLDNCMGSGTTCVAAKNLNRRYIGFELDDKYFNIAKERIG